MFREEVTLWIDAGSYSRFVRCEAHAVLREYRENVFDRSDGNARGGVRGVFEGARRRRRGSKTGEVV